MKSTVSIVRKKWRKMMNKEETKNINKVILKNPFSIFGRCPNCDSRVHRDYNQKYCGNCKEPLEWGKNE